MKFLFVSTTGGHLSLAERVTKEGHYTTLLSANSIGEGIVRNLPITSSLTDTIYNESPDIVIFDDSIYSDQLEELKSKGIKSLFSSRWSNVLSNNTLYNQRLIRSFGFKVYDGTTEGYPCTVEGWFNGNKFIATLFAYNYNRLFNDNIGPKVSSMGSVVWGKFKKGKLYDSTIKAIEIPLRKVEYRGPISLDILINDKNFVVKNICATPRQETTTTLFEGTRTSVSDILFSLATGEGMTLIPLDEWVVMVALSVPPWPYACGTNGDTINITGIADYNIKHIWLEDIKLKDNKHICTHATGRIGYVTARGTTVREARRRVYRTIEGLGVPDLQYRTDIGRDFPDIFSDLRKWGWL